MAYFCIFYPTTPVFVGLARSADRLETILQSQVGPFPGFFRDRLLSSAVSATAGGMYYMPSRNDLDMGKCDKTSLYVLKGGRQADEGMRRFPGIDWSRLPRHFLTDTDTCETNPWMNYNHHQYLYRMSTAGSESAMIINPPSTRIQLLAARTFSRWQDSWYAGRQQQPMERLLVYAREFFNKNYIEAENIAGPPPAGCTQDELVNRAVAALGASPIMTRKAWAVRLATGHVFPSDSYGCRGAVNRDEVDADQTGAVELRYGADTYHIHPLEVSRSRRMIKQF
eukprot:scaffold107569_cov61-Attheya_sp.AAC.4